ncbi:MAG: hypothetical protein JWM76_4469 [Pseudonocardiales bacterium]|nr:hypothetical protein [Pseudonocardiales bacterium]
MVPAFLEVATIRGMAEVITRFFASAPDEVEALLDALADTND